MFRFCLTLSLTALIGCTPAAPEDEASRITGMEWRLQSIAETPFAHAATLVIDNNRIAGVTPCNAYGGGLQGDLADFRVTGLSATEMACADDAQRAAEAKLLDSLAQMRRAERKDDALHLTGGDITMIWTPLN